MRRLFVLILVLLFLPSFQHAGHIQKMQKMVIGQQGGAECDTYEIVCQNFEGSSPDYDNGETWTEGGGASATEDPNWTNTPLRGSESLYLDDAGNDAYTYTTFTAPTGTTYGFGRFELTGGDTSHDFFIILRNTSVTKFTVDCVDDGSGNLEFRMQHGAVTSSDTNDDYTWGTEYCIWYDYTIESGGGGNGTGNLYVAAVSGGNCPSKPPVSLQMSTGDGDAYPDELRLATYDQTSLTVEADQIYLSETNIGNVPN